MGRPSKPVQLIKNEGKSHRTKGELESREAAEKALYSGMEFTESPAVEADPVAHKEFLRLKELYEKIEYIDGLDEQVINRYCLLQSEYSRMRDARRYLQEQYVKTDDEEIDKKLSILDRINSNDIRIDKKLDQLLKLEDRLFLNPTSRIKSIPKNPPKKENTSKISKFINKRRDANGP